MKKIMLWVMAIAITISAAGCTKGYETQKTSGDMTITLAAGAYPLVKGDNNLTIKAVDASGKPLSNAKVDVRYYMPPMPGMAPMEYTTQAAPKGDAFSFNANISMEGGWRVDVSVARPDKPAQTVTFNLDAR
ncbi:MAG TPA: FixH family protein [Nitrospirota bacterium]|nr:FixH family protein [Nitrospirota bacterium]